MTDYTKNLQIDRIWINRHEEYVPNGCIGIEWSGAVGFGSFEIFLDKDGIPHAYTECMDRGEDKEFTRAILSLLADKIVIEE